MESKITADDVIAWGLDFLEKSEKEITTEELKEQKKYAVLIQNPTDKVLLSKMLDESSQIRNNKILARRMKLLIDTYGIPGFFNRPDTLLMKLFSSVGYYFDFIAMPVFKKKLRNDTSKVIINEKPSFLTKHLKSRYSQQIGQNVNLLGEVVLGDAEANNRYEHYLEALKDPRINYISIKISGIYAQISALNYEQNKKDLCERLACIYQRAMDYPFVDENGKPTAKFVNLDMEEYKDTHLTIDVFKTVLSYPQFNNYFAGIVVQAYLPDAWIFQTELLEFSKKRVQAGGTPIKMRLVKGANLQMETIVSSIKGWENPILDTKVKVDANYLRILDRALLPENAAVMHVGVASHNFFSLGYAYLLAQKNNVSEVVTFEMLEGMANHLPRVMRQLGKQIILYTPVVKDVNFLNAVAYLVRRLDENTGIDNFLSYSFNLKANSEQWNFLRNQFEQAYALKESIEPASNRKQNRTIKAGIDHPQDRFVNEPDTNFDLIPNRLWADNMRSEWKKTETSEPYQIPVQIGNESLLTEKKQRYFDRSQDDKVLVCEASLANMEHVKSMMELAEKDVSQWRQSTMEHRKAVLFKTGELIAARRGDFIGCMSAITGKTFPEGDVEISEAIDFCRYYPLSMEQFLELKSVEISPKGIVLVIPPWNFPLAIPVGGVAAALAGGNTVILKPATVALPIAWEFVKCFWEAGIPTDALQIVCTDGREPLKYITSHPAVKHTILTGGTDTAFRLLENNPTCPLSAETGGKNAIIVSASADRDHAVQNIVTSAFSNAGQKCSACSLLILEKEVYDDPEFRNKLIDAVTSLHTGSSWNPANYVGPMITNNNESLLHALTNLEKDEWWLVPPTFVDEKKYMLRPCVKWGVKPGSYSFVNELFAPMLSVVCAQSFAHAIELANSSEYGLTSGVQTLDERERKLWINSIEAGNLYVNRGITGAIVSRQPFGGMKRSAFGGGIKAGGPNYVTCFVNITNKIKNTAQVQELKKFNAYAAVLRNAERTTFEMAASSYIASYKQEFSVMRDIHNLVGEQNILRYLPLKNMLFRISETDALTAILMIISASEVAKTPLTISLNATDERMHLLKTLVDAKNILIQSEDDFITSMENYERIRTCAPPVSMPVWLHAAKIGKYIASQPPLIEGRLELLHYLKEQSISYEYHRYGSITEMPPASY